MGFLSRMNAATRAALARNLRAAREAMGLTQRALARRSGVAQPDISDIERGDPAINPTLDKLSALAHALGTTVADLLTI